MPIKKNNPISNKLNAKTLFEEYCPEVTNYKHKLRGIDGNGNQIGFKEHEKKIIKRGLKKLVSDISKLI